MSAPTKPWERQGEVNHRQPQFQPDQNPSYISTPTHFNPGNGGGGSMTSTLRPPPLPPRQSPILNSFNSYPRPTFSSYGNMGGAMYGNGMYGGGYRSYGQYGMNGLPDNSDENGFLQIAEESSRQAFQSIESIVHAFGSVSMMLESTYHAVYSTFRAVLGVADHFNRMKSHFGQIFSALAVVRTLRWLYHRLLYLIGLKSQDPSLETVWRSANGSLPNASSITESDLKASKSSWPIVLFLGVVFGGPYLIWRLLTSLVPVKPKSHGWMTGQEEHYAAVGQFPFQAKMRGELSFVSGQQLVLAPKDQQPSIQGWLLASNGKNVGLVPANYVKIHGIRPPIPKQGNVQQKHPGNQIVVSGIPRIPFTHPGTHQNAPLVRNFGGQPGTVPTHQRLPPPNPMGVPQTSWQRPPQPWQQTPLTTPGPKPTTWQRTPLTSHSIPLTTQQGAPPPPPLITQQGAPPPPPLITQQGAPPPLTTQQGAPPPLTTQQGAPPPLTTQQGAPPPLTTQQGAPPPLTTQQEAPSLTTQQEAPSLTTQQEAPPPLITRQGAPPPLTTQQGVPPLTTQQEALPLTTQQGEPPPLTIQQGTPPPPLTTQQETPPPPTTQQETPPPPTTQQETPPPPPLLTTQQEAPPPLTTQQEAPPPLTTQQGPESPSQEAPKNPPNTPPPTQQDPPSGSQCLPSPEQHLPSSTPGGADVDVSQSSIPPREDGGISSAEFDEASDADDLDE